MDMILSFKISLDKIQVFLSSHPNLNDRLKIHAEKLNQKNASLDERYTSVLFFSEEIKQLAEEAKIKDIDLFLIHTLLLLLFGLSVSIMSVMQKTLNQMFPTVINAKIHGMRQQASYLRTVTDLKVQENFDDVVTKWGDRFKTLGIVDDQGGTVAVALDYMEKMRKINGMGLNQNILNIQYEDIDLNDNENDESHKAAKQLYIDTFNAVLDKRSSNEQSYSE